MPAANIKLNSDLSESDRIGLQLNIQLGRFGPHGHGSVCVPHRLEARLDYNAKVETLTREAEGSHCTGYAKTAAPHTFPFLNF